MAKQNMHGTRHPRSGQSIARTFSGSILSDRRRTLVFEIRRITEDVHRAQEWIERLNDLRALAYYRLRTEAGGMTPQRAWQVLGAPGHAPATSVLWKKLFERGKALDEYADDEALHKAETLAHGDADI